MAVTQVSDVSGTIELVVSTILTEALQQEAVSLGSSAVRDFSSMVRAGMDSLDIPLLSPLSIQDVSETAEVTAQTITSAEATLNLNRHKSYPFALGDKVSIQSKIAMVREHVMMGAKEFAAEIDDFILGLIDAAASTAAPDHRLALTANPLQDITNAKQLLDEANCPRVGRTIFASPGFVKSLLDDNTIVNANQYGGADPQRNGFVTRLFGFDILESSSSSIVDDGFQACSRDVVAFGRQIQPKFESERKVLAHRWEYSMSHLYGAVATSGSGSRIVVFDADGV